MADDDNRVCRKCGHTFPATTEFFYKHPTGKFGLFSSCKGCERDRRKAYYQTPAGQAGWRAWQAKPENRKKLRQYSRKYYRTEGGRATASAWREANGEDLATYQKQWVRENRERIKAAEQRRRESPEYLARRRAYDAEWKRRKRNDPVWLAHTQKVIAEWRSRPEVSERLRAYRGRYIRERMARDADFRCKFLVATGIRRDLKRERQGAPRAKWWEKYCGYTLADLRASLERQFHAGMSWENHGTMWDIDHIRPLVEFIMPHFDCCDFREAWALSNLRPLTKKANRAKHARRAEEYGPPAPLT